MGDRIKEDDKMEKTIRGLLKLPHNRKCINCNSLGPQYVCTTFSTFVCTNCSGIHREFTHRVKSVSVSKFTAEEVTALQVGGNERTRQIYFKDWDPHRHSCPDGSNLHRLRDFIKHVYVDRQYTGERSTGLPRLILNDSHESRKVDKYRLGSISSHDEDKYERSYAERNSPRGKNDDRTIRYYYDERRSPRYSRANSRHGGYKKSPVLFEIVDDRFRDEGFGNRRSLSGDSKLSNKSRNMDSSCSPVARPLKEILGENVPTLQVGKILKENDGEHADVSAHNQESMNAKPVENVNGSVQSLIDFSTEMETPDAAATSLTQQESSFDTSSSWPSFQSSAKENSSQALSVNTLESLLFGSSVPSALPADDISEASGSEVLSTNVSKNSSNYNLPQTTSSGDTIVSVTDEWPFENMLQQQSSLSLASGSGSIPQQTTLSIEDPNNESRFSSLPHNAQGSISICVEQPSEAVPRPVQDASTGVESQLVNTNSSVRKELPPDLFTARYSSVVTPVSGWQTGPPHGMGFNYYPNSMPAPAFPNPAKSTNPFDISEDRSQFPSVASLQGAAPNVSAPTGLMHAYSLETYYSQLKAPQTATIATMMPPQSSFIESALSPGTFTGQEVHNTIQPSRPRGVGGFGGDGALFGSINTTQQPTGNPPQSSLMGGNPFG